MPWTTGSGYRQGHVDTRLLTEPIPAPRCPVSYVIGHQLYVVLKLRLISKKDYSKGRLIAPLIPFAQGTATS